MKKQVQMKYTEIIILLLIGTINCKPMNKNETINFNRIDFSYYSNRLGNYSIKTSNIGDLFLLYNKSNGENFYLQTKLSIKDIDSLNTLIARIKDIKSDTIYHSDCEDCDFCYLILESNGKLVELFLEKNYDYQGDASLFANYLTNLCIRLGKTMDYDFKFESRKDFFYAAPPPLSNK